MNHSQIKEILEGVREGRISLEEAMGVLKDLPFENLGSSHVDHHRQLRQGIPEVIFSQGKSPDEVVEIARAMFNRSGRFLITRADERIYNTLKGRGEFRNLRFYPRSGIITAEGEKEAIGCITIITAGTSDIPVAEEAQVTARFLGSRVETLYDVGVAGIHRLFAYKEEIEKANVLVVVAGMEGALPSVVGGLTDRIIIAVPTSRGYGTSFGGLTALFSMLNSCVPGIAVMNIDNGFGAGCLAHKINRAIEDK